MMTELNLNDAKGYATERTLRAALERVGLDASGARFVVCRKPDGKWTAIFLIAEFLRQHGGNALMAARHGFMSV